MTKIKTYDNRKTNLTFGDISEGTMFTEPEREEIIIKIPLVEQKTFPTIDEAIPHDLLFNAVTLEGELYTFGDEDEIIPIEEILITMK